MTASLALVLAVLLSPAPVDRSHEGDWFISDTTDNTTGEREVYAIQSYLKADDPDYVTLRLRCDDGKPVLYVEWSNLTFPDRAVLTVSAASRDDEGEEVQYMFEKSVDPVRYGLRATPQTSQAIINGIGAASYATLTAHLATGSRTVGIEVKGTPGAWSRVSRHCPVRRLPLPPV